MSWLILKSAFRIGLSSGAVRAPNWCAILTASAADSSNGVWFLPKNCVSANCAMGMASAFICEGSLMPDVAITRRSPIESVTDCAVAWLIAIAVL